MSFLIEQKIKGRIYIYEVESYWDPGKGQARQRRRYVGKKDTETGKVSTPRKSITPKGAQDFGQVHLLREVAKQIGLVGVLKSVFPEDWSLLLHLGIFKASEGQPFYLYRSWCERTYVPAEVHLSSQAISRFLNSVADEGKQEQFFSKWVTKHAESQTVIFDITSLSSYSSNLDYVEWGYNRDREKLPQVNFGVLYSGNSEHPLAYRLYPGSISDVSTLKNVIAFADAVGIKSSPSFVLDKGFYSKKNIQELLENGLNFVLPLSFSTSLANELVANDHRVLMLPRNGFTYCNRTYFHVCKQVRIGNNTLWAHIYHDEVRKAEELNVLMHKLCELEEKVNERKFREKEELCLFLEDTFPQALKLYSLSKSKSWTIVRNDIAINEFIHSMGKLILLTKNSENSGPQVLDLYRKRDQIEKIFDTMKNEMAENRIRVQSDTTMLGKLFVLFIALILYSQLLKKLRPQKMTAPELLSFMRNLKTITLSNGKSILTEVSKKQRETFQMFDITIPVVPSY